MAFVQASMSECAGMDDSSRTTNPIVTGSSILALKYKDGIIMISDTLGSYGSLARFKNIRRIEKINDYTMIGSGGEFSDFQAISKTLEKLSYLFCIYSYLFY